MTKMLDVLEAFLNHHGHRYLRLDGTTRVEQRQVSEKKQLGAEQIWSGSCVYTYGGGGGGVHKLDWDKHQNNVFLCWARIIVFPWVGGIGTQLHLLFGKIIQDKFHNAKFQWSALGSFKGWCLANGKE